MFCPQVEFYYLNKVLWNSKLLPLLSPGPCPTLTPSPSKLWPLLQDSGKVCLPPGSLPETSRLSQIPSCGTLHVRPPNWHTFLITQSSSKSPWQHKLVRPRSHHKITSPSTPHVHLSAGSGIVYWADALLEWEMQRSHNKMSRRVKRQTASSKHYSALAAAAAKSLQSCPTLCAPIDGSPPGSAVPGILQARTLEWVAISFSDALLTIVKTWKQPWCPPTEEWVKTMGVRVYNGTLLSHKNMR